MNTNDTSSRYRVNTKAPLNTYVRKVRRNLLDYGLFVALNKSFLYLFKPLFERRIYRIYKIDLRNYTPQDISDSRFQFRILKPEDTHEIRQVESIAEWLKGALRNKIVKNDMCVVAMDGPIVAAFNIISFDPIYIPLINQTRQSKPGRAWSEHIAVHKEYRQMGLGTMLRQFVFKQLTERSIYLLYGGTLITNIPALKLARKVGFKEIVDVEYIKIGFHKQWLYKRVRG